MSRVVDKGPGSVSRAEPRRDRLRLLSFVQFSSREQERSFFLDIVSLTLFLGKKVEVSTYYLEGRLNGSFSTGTVTEMVGTVGMGCGGGTRSGVTFPCVTGVRQYPYGHVSLCSVSVNTPVKT